MNELQTVKAQEMTPAELSKKAEEYLDVMGCKLPQKDKAMFLELSSAFGLNPFKREIYAVGYGDKWNIITGYEVYLKRAERLGKLDGWKATVEGRGDTMTATVVIYRKDWREPFMHTVLFSECVQKTKEGKPNSVWAKMPSFMLRKVAIAQAFRLCFPEDFSGMPYIADEMPPIERDITPAEVKESIKADSSSPKTQSKKAKPTYTKEEAEEVGKILGSAYSDGSPVFDAHDYDTYRKMLIEKGGQDTLTSIKKLLQTRLDSVSPEGISVTPPQTDSDGQQEIF